MGKLQQILGQNNGLGILQQAIARMQANNPQLFQHFMQSPYAAQIGQVQAGQMPTFPGQPAAPAAPVAPVGDGNMGFHHIQAGGGMQPTGVMPINPAAAAGQAGAYMGSMGNNSRPWGTPQVARQPGQAGGMGY